MVSASFSFPQEVEIWFFEAKKDAVEKRKRKSNERLMFRKIKKLKGKRGLFARKNSGKLLAIFGPETYNWGT